MKISILILVFFIGASSFASTGSSTDWEIEVHSKSHGAMQIERWVKSSNGSEKTLSLKMKAGGTQMVPASSDEIDFLSYDLAPLSLEKKGLFELGLCAQFIRIKTEFGSRKFCQRQIKKNPKLASLLSKLEVYRRKTLNGKANR